jgi:glycosyltransferase involved in cell wall biosynthesis
MTPIVSIVTTVRNAEAYLPEAMASVSAQTHADHEHIVWDDGSTDGTLAIAQAYAVIDPRVHVVAGRKLGRARSLKAACNVARGLFMGLVDADDVLEPKAIEKCLDVLRSDMTAGFVYTQYHLIGTTGANLGLGSRPFSQKYSPEALLDHFMTFHFRLMRSAVYSLAGGIDVRFPLAMDYDLCLRMSEVAGVAYLTEPLYRYRLNPDGLSSSGRARQEFYASRAVAEAKARRSNLQKGD